MEIETVRIFNIGLISAIASGVLVLGSPNAASAQVDEIIVTAEKREASLQDVPVSITAFSEDTIQQQQIDSMEDLQFKTPGLVYGNLNGFSLISLRGIGGDLTTLAGETAVATFTDGVYQGQTFIQGVPGFDLERIEILRGPQGTLYGRNSTGGTVNFISKKPSDIVELNTSILIGSEDRTAIDLGLNGPIIEGKLAGRISLRREKHDGYRTNLSLNEETDDLDHVSGRAALLFTPNDNLEIILRGDKTDRESSNPRQVAGVVSVNPSGVTPSTPLSIFSIPAPFLPAGMFSAADLLLLGAGSVGDYFGLTAPGLSTDPSQTEDHYSDFSDHQQNIDLWGTSGTVTFGFGEATVKSITAFRDSTLGGSMEQDGSGAAILYLDPFEQTGEQFTQEINIFGSSADGSIDWLLGGFYFNEDAVAEFNFFLPALGDLINLNANLSTGGLPVFDLSLPGVVPGVFVNVLNFADPVLGSSFDDGLVPSTAYLGFLQTQESKSWALFGQSTAHVSDRLRATGGIRYTRDEKNTVRSLHSNFVPVVALCESAREGDSWTAFTGTAGLDFDWSDNTLLFGKVSRGYKAGGFNAAECAGSFDPETIWAFEIGTKSMLFNQQLQTNMSAFFYDYQDIQFTTYIGNASSIRNAAGAELYGLELEVAFAPKSSPGLLIDGSLSYLHSEYDSFLFQDPFALATLDVGGNQLVRAPEWKSNVGIQYSWDTRRIGFFTLRGDTARSSEYYHDIFNGKAPGQSATKEDAFTISNIRLNWKSDPEATWEIQGFVENLEDNLYGLSRASSATTGTITGEFSQPRIYGVRFTARIGG